MQTTEIKYAIMDRVTGKLLTYNHVSDDWYPTSNKLFKFSTDSKKPVWYISDKDDAFFMLNNRLNYGAANYNTPSHGGLKISPDSHCVVKVTMVCNVEIVE